MQIQQATALTFTRYKNSSSKGSKGIGDILNVENTNSVEAELFK